MPLRLLKPVFFRVGAAPALHSGWINTATVGQHAPPDIYAHVDDLARIGAAIFPQDPFTAARLQALEPGTNSVALVPGARPGLLIGERVRFTRAFDIPPYGWIAEGERGVVGRRDKQTGEVEIFLEEYHATLDEFSNVLPVTPHEAAEALDALESFIDPFTAPAVMVPDDYRAA